MFDRLLDAAPWLTSACWIALLTDALTPSFHLTDAAARLALTGAIVGTIVLAAVKLGRPASDVYLMGKAMGRAEALAEVECDDVVRMRDRVHLRPVRNAN